MNNKIVDNLFKRYRSHFRISFSYLLAKYKNLKQNLSDYTIEYLKYLFIQETSACKV